MGLRPMLHLSQMRQNGNFAIKLLWLVKLWTIWTMKVATNCKDHHHHHSWLFQWILFLTISLLPNLIQVSIFPSLNQHSNPTHSMLMQASMSNITSSCLHWILHFFSLQCQELSWFQVQLSSCSSNSITFSSLLFFLTSLSQYILQCWNSWIFHYLHQHP